MKNAENRRKDPLWAKLLSLAFGFLLIAGIEGGTRLLTHETHLDKILDVLQQDPVLFWRNRPNLNTTFFGENIATNEIGLRTRKGASRNISPEHPGTLRIICMGASPTFGWGVAYDKTYSSRLEKLLRNEMRMDAEVINAGMIGHSSYQGKILLKRELAALKPDIITVPYVINDIDKYRFFQSDGRQDKYLQPQNKTVVGLRGVLYRSRFFRLFEKSSHYLLGRRGTFEGKPLEIYRPKQSRVPPADYRANLNEIIDFAQKNGIKVVLIKFPVNLPAEKKLPKENIDQSKQLLSEGIRLVDGKDYKTAVSKFKQAAARNPYLSEAYYFLGVSYRRLGSAEKAKQAFQKAFESESYRCGSDGIIYNRIMEDVSRKRNVPIVDVVTAFNQRKGEYLFLSPKDDPIHPNAAGHDIIAHQIFEAINKMGH